MVFGYKRMLLSLFPFTETLQWTNLRVGCQIIKSTYVFNDVTDWLKVFSKAP